MNVKVLSIVRPSIIFNMLHSNRLTHEKMKINRYIKKIYLNYRMNVLNKPK